MYIDLLRHGETTAGVGFHGSSDNELTAKGWSQLRQRLDTQVADWNYIVSSPLLRCSMFAKEVATKYSLPMITDKRFQEIHFGQWEGCHVDEIQKTDGTLLSKFWSDPINNTPPQAENIIAFQSRVLEGWNDIISTYYDKKVLLICHGGVIRILLCHILQQPLKHLLSFQVEHASLHKVDLQMQNNSQLTMRLMTSSS